jgi:hypothetical protein
VGADHLPTLAAGAGATSTGQVCAHLSHRLVVMPDANLDLSVDGALFGGFGTAGQRCNSLGTALYRLDD